MADRKATAFTEDVALVTDFLPFVRTADTVNYKDAVGDILALYDDKTATLTEKTFDQDGSGNNITNLANASIKAAAGIVYSKLNLTGAILNADLAGSIQFLKLESMTDGNILVGSVGNVATQVAMTGDVSISNTGVTTVTLASTDLTDSALIWLDASTNTGTNKTLQDFSNNILADGQHLEIRNETGVAITKGQVVYISGYSVGQDLPLVTLADASVIGTMPSIGVVADASIANNANGGLCVTGRMDGLNTSSFTIGDELYVSETAGGLVNTKPTGAALIQKIATVLRVHASLGVIEINFARVNDLSNIPDGDMWIGNASAVPTAVTMSGDITITNAGVTSIGADKVVTAKILNSNVTYAKIQNVSATSRFLGRITAGAGVIEELTGTQATTLLNVFTDALQGLVPASGGGTTNFLRADGTFAAPAGGGDMVLADVQTSTGKKTFAADATLAGINLNSQVPSAPVEGDIWFTGSFINYRSSVANRVLVNTADAQTLTNKTLTSPILTTPTLGTPSSGNLANCTALPTTALTGIIPDARMPNLTGDVTTVEGAVATTIVAGAVDIAMLSASGSPDGTNFLRGDNTWSVPAGGGDMVLADVQTVTGAKTFGTIGGAVGKFILAGSTSGSSIINAAAVAGTTTITFQGTTGTVALTSDLTGFFDTAGTGLTSSGSTVNVIGTASRITANANDIDIASDYVGQASITTLGTIATGTWQGTTIAVNQGGTGVTTSTGTTNVVLSNSPTIVTPTIASFANAGHDHQDAAGGGTLLSTAALSDTANLAYLNTANVYTAGVRQDFLGLLAGTAGLNVGGIAGNPTTQVNGDIWLNTSSNTLFGRINGVNVDLGQSGSEVLVWTANHDMATFNLISTGSQTTSRINLPNGAANAIGFENSGGTANFEIYGSATGDRVVVTADLELLTVGSNANNIMFRNEILGDNSVIGNFDFRAQDDATNDTRFASIQGKMQNDDDAGGNEAGSLQLKTRRSSTLHEWLNLNLANDNEFHCDVPSGGLYRFDVNAVTALTIDVTSVISTLDVEIGKANSTVLFTMDANHTTLAANDVIGRIVFADTTTVAPAEQTFGQISMIVHDPANASYDAEMLFEIGQAGSLQQYMVMNEDGNGQINILKNIDMTTGLGISWNGSINRRISHDGSSLILEVQTGQNFIYEVNTAQVTNISATGSLIQLEKAAADADVATFGQYWVRNDVPNTAMFTGDTGLDYALSHKEALEFTIDGGGSTITTGVKGDLEIPANFEIERVTMLADQSGSIVVDIWEDTYANYPPTDADSITASAVPTITTAVKSQDATLTGWTTAIIGGSTLRFNVDSVTTITRVLISLWGRYT